MDKYWNFLLVIILVLVVYYLFYLPKSENFTGLYGETSTIPRIGNTYSESSTRRLEAVIKDEAFGVMRKVDLRDFFQFLEYFMVTDMDPRDKDPRGVCNRGSETVRIRNNTLNLLRMLHFIVNCNKKDNYYHRFIVTNSGPYLKDVKDYFTKDGYDFDWSRASRYSEIDYPQSYTLNIHNYYNYENTRVNLLALKKLIELSQYNNTEYLMHIFLPTENLNFQDYFLNPLRSIVNSILEIIRTDIFRSYLHDHKFRLKYKGSVLNPHLQSYYY